MTKPPEITQNSIGIVETKYFTFAEPPTIIKVFLAAKLAFSPPILMSRYKVRPINPHRIKSKIKLLARTAPTEARAVKTR